jgi:tetratricopeptide (TPR) repeat protein
MAKTRQTAKTKAQTIAVNATAMKTFPFFITGFVFICMSLYLSFAPDVTRGWGLNAISYFTPWAIVLFYLLLLCFWIPQTNQWIIRIMDKISRPSAVSFPDKYKYILFAVAGIILSAVFHLLKIKYFFLGDMDIRATQIENGEIIREEYFTMWLLIRIYTLLNVKFEFTGLDTIQLSNQIIAVLFIFFSLCTADIAGKTFIKKLSVFVVSTLSLTVLLQFCGYPEVYALPLLFLQAYLFTALLHLKGKAGVWLPFVILVAGIAFHMMLVCLFPSLIFLFYRSVLWKYPLFKKRSTFLILLVVSAPFLYVAFQRFALPMMLPMEPGPRKLLTLFSIAHYKEFMNSQLLGSGIGFFTWIAILVYSLIYRIRYDATLWFFLIASLSITGLMFVFNGIRGAGDWDIFAFAPMVYNLGNICFLLALHEKKLCKNIKYGVLMIAGFSLLHTSAWIITNKTDVSIKWFESAISTDPANYYRASFSNESLIAAALSANGLKNIAIQWSYKAYRKYGNTDPRVGYNYAHELVGLGRTPEAYPIWESVVKSFPLYPMPYPILIEYYIKSEKYNLLYNLLIQMEAAYKQNPAAFTGRISDENLKHYFDILSNLKKQVVSNQ